MRPLMPPVQTPDNLFHDGNPLTGELGTIVDAEHLNNVQGAVRDAQSELITVLNAAGINVDPSKQNQLLTALKALLLSRSNPFGDIKSDGTVKTALENLGLTAALAAKAPLASPALTGTPTAPTPSLTTNNTQIATTNFVHLAISSLINSAPAALDTLGELAAAIGNDPNYSTSVSNALSGKASGDLFYDVSERVGMRTSDKQFLVSVGADGTFGFWSEAQKKFVFWVDASGQLTTGIIPAARVTGLAEIGVGQTWADMKAQRAFNTVYTNSTGKPISISVTGRNQTQQTYTELLVGSVKVSANYKDSNSDSVVTAIVPAGSTYKVVATGGALLNWAELS